MRAGCGQDPLQRSQKLFNKYFGLIYRKDRSLQQLPPALAVLGSALFPQEDGASQRLTNWQGKHAPRLCYASTVFAAFSGRTLGAAVAIFGFEEERHVDFVRLGKNLYRRLAWTEWAI